eukprot:COSAG01_NODE_12073_length_1805_cov_1.366354_1_plen_235_part_00
MRGWPSTLPPQRAMSAACCGGSAVRGGCIDCCSSGHRAVRSTAVRRGVPASRRSGSGRSLTRVCSALLLTVRLADAASLDDAPASTAAAGQKRGLCGHTCNSSLLFSPRARNWQYNYVLNLPQVDAEWGTRSECRDLAASTDFDYVPMVAHCSPNDCGTLEHAASKLDNASTKLLGFNEPNGNPSACADPESQACRKECLPSTAAARWPEFERLAGLRQPRRLLGTPAPGGLCV